MWRKEAIHQEFMDATIIDLFKQSDRGILKSVTITGASLYCQLFGRVLLNRVNEHLEQSGLLPESQCGFRKDRGTTDIIFTARQLQEKCQEQNVDLYMTFVELYKAFDTVSREGIWENNGKVWLSCQIL